MESGTSSAVASMAHKQARRLADEQARWLGAAASQQGLASKRRATKRAAGSSRGGEGDQMRRRGRAALLRRVRRGSGVVFTRGQGGQKFTRQAYGDLYFAIAVAARTT
jgi:hypothetical protein